MKRFGLPILLVVIVVAMLALFLSGNKAAEQKAAAPIATKANADGLPGLITTQGSWDSNGAKLKERLDTLGLPALSQEALAFHIHQHMDLFVHGQKVDMPANIGISTTGNFISILHMHDKSGVLHVESPNKVDYTLGQFFDEWGVKLATDQLGGYKNDGTNTLKVYVNGTPVTTDIRKLALKAHQEIVVAYGTEAELPSPVPPSFAFPQGE